MKKLLIIAIALLSSPILLAAERSYILFMPVKGKIKSGLVNPPLPPVESQIPNYFKPKKGAPLFKVLLEKDLKNSSAVPKNQ